MVTLSEANYIAEKVKEKLADANKFSTAGEIDEKYLTPLEDIFEEIEEIVDDDGFGLYFDKYHDALRCSAYSCNGRQLDDTKIFPHTEKCEIRKLKDLIATLGDMIS